MPLFVVDNDHYFNNSLKLYTRMLRGEIKLPHRPRMRKENNEYILISGCDICFKASLSKMKYKESLLKEKK